MKNKNRLGEFELESLLELLDEYAEDLIHDDRINTLELVLKLREIISYELEVLR